MDSATAPVLLLVALVFVILRRFTPAVAIRPPDYRYSREELDTRFSGTSWIVNLAVLAVSVVLGLGTYAALAGLNRYFANADGSPQLYLLPESATWWFFPILGALSVSWGITLDLWTLLGHREDAELFAYWTSLKAGFDSSRILRWCAVLISLPIGILTILELPRHVAFGTDDFRDCGFAFASCKVFRYSDARRMTIIDGYRRRDTMLMARAGIVIDFSDGRRWSSAEIGEFKERPDPALQELLENRTRLPYNHSQTENEIPPLVSGPAASSR